MTEKITPIHKFNNGDGATLCNVCRKVISRGLTDNLYCFDHHELIKKPFRIFLDDFRNPQDSASFMMGRIGPLASEYRTENWLVIRTYEEFIKYITMYAGRVTHISWDHDLAPGHYHQNMQEGTLNYDSEDFQNDEYKTGYHAAKFMKELYKEKGLEWPVMYVHSMNPTGTQNIINLFKDKES